MNNILKSGSTVITTGGYISCNEHGKIKDDYVIIYLERGTSIPKSFRTQYWISMRDHHNMKLSVKINKLLLGISHKPECAIVNLISLRLTYFKHLMK